MHALTCDISRDGLNAVIHLTGELDIATQALLVAVATPCIAYGATLTLECSRLSFMDSRGLKAILRLQRSAHNAGASLELAGLPPAVTRILTLSGLDPFFTTSSSPSAA